MLFGDGASGQVHAYVRPISQRLSSPLATMGVRLRVGHQTAARALGHNCSSGIARSASTTDFPITRNGTSCRISELMFDIRVPPSLLGTSRRGDLAGSRAYDGAYGVWTVVFPAHHQRPGNARDLARQGHGGQPNGAASQHTA